MPESQEVEQDEIDATKEKAEDIGKELGIEKDEIPDYDIQEEDDDKLAKERDTTAKPAKEDRYKLTNREKRLAKKKKINNVISEKDAIIQRQQQELERLAQRQNEVEGRLSGINKNELEKAWNDTVAAFNQAEMDHAAAFTEGDGAKATKAMRVMYDAQRRIEQLNGVKQQLENPPAKQRQAQQPDNRVITKKAQWESHNSWYKTDARDSDSEVARALAGAIANEGFDPGTDDYWDELDERVAKYLPDKAVQDDEDEDEDEPAPRPVRKRSSPPIAGGNGRPDLRGKKTVTLPTAFIQTLKDNGIYDDVEKRNRVIQRYLNGQKELQKQ